MHTTIILSRTGYQIKTALTESAARDIANPAMALKDTLHVCIYGPTGEIVLQSGLRAA